MGMAADRVIRNRPPGGSRDLHFLLDRGLTTRANICKELGLGNFYHNAAALGQEERYLKEQNVTVALANPGAPVSQDKKSDDDLTSQQNKKE